MEEYRLIIQKGECRPYSLWTFSTFDACYFKMLQMINEQQTHVRKEYFVINDFYNNIYPPFLAEITKYKIEYRNVGEWNVYSKKNKMEDKKKDSQINNKILYMTK